MTAAAGTGPAALGQAPGRGGAARPVSSAEPAQRPAMRGVKAPTAAGLLPWVGVVVALIVLAVAVVLLRDALLATGAISGTAWLVSATDWVQGLSPSWWWVALGVLLIVVGVWLVGVAVRRRRRTAYAVRATTGVYIGLRDVGRLAAGVAQQVDGVTSASAAATPGRIAVRVEVTGSEDAVVAAVTRAVQERLGDLVPVPRCTVRSRLAGST